MILKRLRGAILLVAGTASAAAFAQTESSAIPITTDRPARTDASELNFESLSTLYPSGKTTLVNGTTEIDLAAWPAIVIARLDSGGFCTATVVGPSVLLTAAHCVDAGFGDKGATIGGRAHIRGSVYDLVGCEMHEDYIKADRQSLDLPRTDVDYALCELNGSPPIILETLASDSAVRNTPLLMTGFGCTGIRVVANALSFTSLDTLGNEQLRMGDEKVDMPGVRDHTAAPGVYLRTRSESQEPILCPGDSGGPALTGATLAEQNLATRRLAGINSMVTALPIIEADKTIKYLYFSYMASIATPEFRSFQKKWKSKSEATRAVCGIDIPPGQHNCRGD